MKNPALWFSLILVVLSPWSTRAQESDARKRIRVIGQTERKPPADMTETTHASKEAKKGVQMQFGPSADVKDVLEFYRVLTGRQIVYGNTVVGPCPLIVHERVAPEKAISLIENALFANGFTLIDLPDRGMLQVGGIGQAPAQFPIPVFTKLDELPERERVVKMVFKIRHRDVVELAQRVMLAYPPAPYLMGNSCIADPKSKTLVVTERTSTIREIAKMVEQLDVFDTRRLIRISLIMIGAAVLLLLVLMPLLGRRSFVRIES